MDLLWALVVAWVLAAMVVRRHQVGHLADRQASLDYCHRDRQASLDYSHRDRQGLWVPIVLLQHRCRGEM
jgi:hypothetical protein